MPPPHGRKSKLCSCCQVLVNGKSMAPSEISLAKKILTQSSICKVKFSFEAAIDTAAPDSHNLTSHWARRAEPPELRAEGEDLDAKKVQSWRGRGFIERKTGIVTPRVWDRDTLRPAGHHDVCPETLEWTGRHPSAG